MTPSQKLSRLGLPRIEYLDVPYAQLRTSENTTYAKFVSDSVKIAHCRNGPAVAM
jgi:hypothetical protein